MTLHVISQCAMLLVSWVSAAALPCNIPVFRYALERWPSDDYQLVVYHKGPLPEQAEKDAKKNEGCLKIRQRESEG